MFYKKDLSLKEIQHENTEVKFYMASTECVTVALNTYLKKNYSGLLNLHVLYFESFSLHDYPRK